MRYLMTLTAALLLIPFTSFGQLYEVTSGWKAKRISEVALEGEDLTIGFEPDSSWINAIVPGTVLSTLLANGLVPDPFFGMNNSLIPDISEVGRDFYSYWFYNGFNIKSFTADRQIWLNFRGVNYSCDIFLNGHKLNNESHEGMFMNQRFNITRYLIQDGRNHLAVSVRPPNNVGVPNGGQAGDGTIGRDVTMQFTTGWDWIEPVADRNTGIWDKVTIEVVGPVEIRNPHIVSKVPGIRDPLELQSPAEVTVSADLHNASTALYEGTFGVKVGTDKSEKKIKIPAGETVTVTLSTIKVKEPKLWWPNGMGLQSLTTAEMWVSTGKDVFSDIEIVDFGIREFSSEFDEVTGGRIFYVNGNKVFIKGGNWIASDMLLRLSPERYEAEVKMHAEMNMNMLRVWGGSITERPEFYDACDKLGILVWQDLWITGDSNGRWPDAKKADNQTVRRGYPDNHELFINSVADQVRMLRNHPSLVIWCGGNEFPPPPDIDSFLRDSLFPSLDPGKFYLSESTGKQLMTNSQGGTGDGPYGIMEPEWFFTFKSFPFNAEIGSVGLPVERSLAKFLSPEALTVPDDDNLNAEWRYHKYLTYKDFPSRYGAITGFSDFVRKAQMVNYVQYRSLQEGRNTGMWNSFTGTLIWKTQNPWTALRGQFYDVYLEQNAGYYGYKHAAKPFHAQINLNDTTLCVINAGPKEKRDNLLRYSVYDMRGALISSSDTMISVGAESVTSYGRIPVNVPSGEPAFVRLKLQNRMGTIVHDESMYWLAPYGPGSTPLSSVNKTTISAELTRTSESNIDVMIVNQGDDPAVFVQFWIVDIQTGEGLVPIYFEDNFLTIMPGERKFFKINTSQVSTGLGNKPLSLYWEGLNVEKANKLF